MEFVQGACRTPFACRRSASRCAPGESHVNGGRVDAQRFGDGVCIIVQRVPQGQDLAVGLVQQRHHVAELREGFFPFQTFLRRRLAALYSVHRLRRVRAVTPKGALGVVLRQVPRHPQQPGPRVENVFAVFPLFPKPQERLLRHVHRGIGVHPTGVGQRPDFPAVFFVQRLEVRAGSAPYGGSISPVHSSFAPPAGQGEVPVLVLS